MIKTENVLLCGCGWLGQQLIQPLAAAGYTVSATSRCDQKLNRLIENNVIAAPFSLGEPFPNYLLFNSLPTAAIIMLPPGRRSANMEYWLKHLQSLCKTLLEGNVHHIVFISTTAVYGDIYNGEINEESEVAPQTESAKAHVAIENFLQQHAENKHTILRLAGLVGPARHPINTLSGRTLSHPNKVTNLVHSDDIISGMMRLLELGPQVNPLHMCSLEHPQRKAYYDASATAFALTPAKFTPNTNTMADSGKQINALRTWTQLGISPRYPSPYDMLPKS